MAFSVTRRARGPLAALIALTLAALAAPAIAQDAAPVLREQIRVHAELVTLGDIFEHAGPAAEAAVFRSPDLGAKGMVSAERVRAAAQQHGLYWDNPGGVARIGVERPGRLITLEEITAAIAAYAGRELDIGAREDLMVTLERRAREYHVDARIEEALTVRRLHVRGDAFEAEVGFETEKQGARAKVYRGRIQETLPVPVPVRAIDRGETIPEEAVETLRLPRAHLRAGIVLDEAELAGMAAKRTLNANEPVRAADIEHPRLVTRNSLVTVVYRTGGLTLKAQGLAQEDAHEGATVAVLNQRSKRIVQGVVRGPGLVAIESPAPAQPAPDARRNASAGARVVR